MLEHRRDRELTRELIRILAGKQSTSRVGCDHLVDFAAKNKVLLQLLRAFNVEGPSRESQEKAMGEVIRNVGMLSRALDDYDYSFFKLVKPIGYVPADIDLLVNWREAYRAAKKIREMGYRAVVSEPYCITFVRGSSIIDLYIHPTLGGVAYLDGQRLLEHVGTKVYNGFEIRTLKEYAEAIVTAAHAIYKERIYTLNDYFTVKEWSSSESFALAQELKCAHTLKLALSLNEKIEIVRSPRVGRLVLSKLTRQTY